MRTKHKWIQPLLTEVLETHPLITGEATQELETNLVSQGCDREFNKGEQTSVAKKLMSLMGICPEEL